MDAIKQNLTSLVGCKVKLKKEFTGTSFHEVGVIITDNPRSHLQSKELYVLGVKIRSTELPTITVLWEDETASVHYLNGSFCNYYDVLDSNLASFV